MIHMRPFTATNHDYVARVALHNAIWPDWPDTVARCQGRDSLRNQAYFFQRVVVEVEHQIVAAGTVSEPTWSHRPGKYALGVDVHPAHERQGIGSALYDHLLQMVTQRLPAPTVLVSRTREDKLQALRFLAQRGFTQVMRSPVSRLAVATFDPAQFAGLLDNVRTAGYQLYSMAEVAKLDPDWQRQVYELDWECTQDEPLPDAPTKPAFADYVKENFDYSHFLPAASFVALANGHYVAMTTGFQDAAESTLLITGFTGVVRAHRRRGLATALKVLTIAYAQQNHFKAIETGNEESNPMYRINLALGFQPKPAWLDFQKMIE
ncbi:MAG: GNAT family N-acetyltransferase [Caldilineaceae bacterium]